MPQETKSHVDHGTVLNWTKGARVESGDPRHMAEAIEMAANYRGDVTITLASTGETIEGYIFDHRPHPDFSRAIVRVIPKGTDDRRVIACDDIAVLEFTGRDTAEGKSFETWMKKYVRQKLSGKAASIEAESLEDE